jgi:hypothetical protein
MVYSITNLTGYATDIRRVVAESLDLNVNNLDDYMTVKQVISLLNEYCIGFDSQHYPVINQDINVKIAEDARVWMSNSILAKLAAEDKVECAWDDANNEMVFWDKT